MNNEQFVAMVKDVPHIMCPGDHDPQQLHTLAHIKRFAELFIADPDFRADYEKMPQETIDRYGIDVRADEVMYIAQSAIQGQVKFPDEIPLSLKWHFAYYYEKMQHRQNLQASACAPKHTQFKLWRERQLNRCWGELGSSNLGFIHVPIVFELSTGCSMGCPFCALAAAKLEGVFAGTDENLTFWREVLLEAKSVIGTAAGTGVCYCATEPFDNPDYEKFSAVYEDVFGIVPQVTSAASMREPERTKAFLRRVKCNPGIHRFSVLSLALYRQICAYFTPEELLYVEILPRFPEAIAYNQITKAGRAFVDEENVAQTISCASGFVVNMLDKSIRITTPCNADAAHPTGEIALGSAHFTDSHDFRWQLEWMIDTYMKTTVNKGKILKFPRYYSFSDTPPGFVLESKAKLKVHFKNHEDSLHDTYGEIGKLIQEGKWNAREIAGRLLEEKNIEPAEVFHCVNYLYKAGCLEEN